MSTPPTGAVATGPLPALRAYWLADGLRVVHAFKTALAVAVGLAVCMRLELSSPRTTMVSIVIVMMHQQAGMTIARSIFRIIGMTAGCLASLWMVRYLSQSFAAFYLVLALWTAGCVWGAYYHRNYQSYAFVLAGYAVAIVAVPAFVNPYGIVDSVIFTLSDVLIAIVTGSLVNALVFPQQVRPALFAAGQRHCSHLIAALRTVLAGKTDEPTLDALHVKLTGEHTEMEALRSAAIFEDPALRQRLWALRGITSEFLDVTAALHALHRAMHQTFVGDRAAAKPAIDRLNQWIATGLPAATSAEVLDIDAITRFEAGLNARLSAFNAMAPTFAPDATSPAVARHLFATSATILRNALDDLAGYLRYFTLARTPDIAHPDLPTGRAPERAPTSTANRWAATIGATRAFVVILAVASIWYASGWNGGSTAVTGAAITAALFATFPNPARASTQIFLGAVLGSFVAALFSLGVAPHLYGFPMLAIAVAPVVMLGSYLGSFPSLGPLGVGFNIYFCYVANITNPATIDPAMLFDSAFAFCLGIGGASVTFRLLTPTSGDLLARLYVRQLRRMVSGIACQARIDAGTLFRFESGVRDFLVQMGAPPSLNVPRQWGFAALDVGSAALKVRMLSSQWVPSPSGWDATLAHWLAAIARVFDVLTPGTHAAAVGACEAVLRALDTQPGAADEGLRADLRAWVHFVKLGLCDPESPLQTKVQP